MDILAAVSTSLANMTILKARKGVRITLHHWSPPEWHKIYLFHYQKINFVNCCSTCISTVKHAGRQKGIICSYSKSCHIFSCLYNIQAWTSLWAETYMRVTAACMMYPLCCFLFVVQYMLPISVGKTFLCYLNRKMFLVSQIYDWKQKLWYYTC